MKADELLDILDGMTDMGIPEGFAGSVYSPGELQRRLGIPSESEFWMAYRMHRIPAGVWLPTSEPFCCWDRELIEHWISCGMPMCPTVVKHNIEVTQRLIQAVEHELTAPKPERN